MEGDADRLIGALGLSATVSVFFFSGPSCRFQRPFMRRPHVMAAWAAARRAMGTRNGEQET